MPDTPQDGQRIIFVLHRAGWQWAALKALVGLGVSDQLADGPLSVTELATRCGAHAPTLARLLRTVAGLGFVRTVSPGAAALREYELTGAGQALLGLERYAILNDVDLEVNRALAELPETIRTGVSPFVQRYGSMFSYLASHPDSPSADAFDKLMTARGSQGAE
jgi:AraC-like DNA-binding protein